MALFRRHFRVEIFPQTLVFFFFFPLPFALVGDTYWLREQNPIDDGLARLLAQHEKPS